VAIVVAVVGDAAVVVVDRRQRSRRRGCSLMMVMMVVIMVIIVMISLLQCRHESTDSVPTNSICLAKSLRRGNKKGRSERGKLVIHHHDHAKEAGTSPEGHHSMRVVMSRSNYNAIASDEYQQHGQDCMR